MANFFVNGPCFLYVGVPYRLPYVTGTLQPVPNVLQANVSNELNAAAVLPEFGNDPEGLRTVDTLPSSVPYGNPPPNAVASAVVYYLTQYAPVYLGTSERGVEIEIYPEYSPVYRDDGGKPSADKMYEGETGAVFAELTRWNENVYAFCSSTAAAGILGIPTSRGTDLNSYAGTHMVAEGASYPLWCVGSYAGRFEQPGMPSAYRFFAAMLMSDRLAPLGSMAKKIRLAWDCQRFPGAGAGGWSLYDHNAAGLPLPD